jgi:oligopeptide/dipeptide ABC transporter ATP-binding protein
LLRAIPEPDPRRTVPRDLPRGEVPDAARPPLGCSFHPRCPRAFEVCGWESRDLKDLLERRWAGMEEEAYEAEQRAVGPVEPLDEPVIRATLPGREAAAVLERAREADPAEPFWTGVRRIAEADGHVEIEWHEPVEPRLLPAGSVQVECHLYDEEALAEAGRRRSIP